MLPCATAASPPATIAEWKGVALRNNALVHEMAPPEECLRSIAASRLGYAVVLNDERRPLGIVDADDALTALPARLPARAYLKPFEAPLFEPHDVSDALRTMTQKGLRYLLLGNASDGVFGVLACDDLLPTDHARLRKNVKSLESFVNEMRNEVEEVRRENLKVLGILAHDLRGPLGGIRGLAELLDGESRHIPDDLRKFPDLIISQSNRLLNLVNDVLELARTGSGRVPLNLSQLDPAALLRGACLIYVQAAQRKGIGFELRLPEGAAPQIYADFDRLQTVLGNLLDNAVKYSAAGQTIRATLETSPHQVAFTVEDNGQGLPKAELDRLFTRFGRGSSRPTGNEPSSGLGLAIAREIVQSHGGNITVTGDLGQGLRFRVSIPVHAVAGKPEPVEQLERTGARE